MRQLLGQSEPLLLGFVHVIHQVGIHKNKPALSINPRIRLPLSRQVLKSNQLDAVRLFEQALDVHPAGFDTLRPFRQSAGCNPLQFPKFEVLNLELSFA